MSDAMREKIAEIVYASMLWAYQDGSGNKGPKWLGGNSFAEDEARRSADAIIAAPELLEALTAALDEIERLRMRC